MSNRRAFFIWISVNIESSHHFRLALPIPLFLLLGVSDFLYDAAFFMPSSIQTGKGKKLSPAVAKQIVLASADFLREIAINTEPFDLADVDITDGQKRFVVKCLLR